MKAWKSGSDRDSVIRGGDSGKSGNTYRLESRWRFGLSVGKFVDCAGLVRCSFFL